MAGITRGAVVKLTAEVDDLHEGSFLFFLPLPLWERSDRIGDAIRVRGYGLSIDLNPSPQPSPTRGEGAHHRCRDSCANASIHLDWNKRSRRKPDEGNCAARFDGSADAGGVRIRAGRWCLQAPRHPPPAFVVPAGFPS